MPGNEQELWILQGSFPVYPCCYFREKRQGGILEWISACSTQGDLTSVRANFQSRNNSNLPTSSSCYEDDSIPTSQGREDQELPQHLINIHSPQLQLHLLNSFLPLVTTEKETFPLSDALGPPVSSLSTSLTLIYKLPIILSCFFKCFPSLPLFL